MSEPAADNNPPVPDSRVEVPGHIPVLLREILDVLSPREGETCADATAGRGGHASAVGAAIGSSGGIVLNDADAGNLEFAAARVRGTVPGHAAPTVTTIHGNFALLPRRMEQAGLEHECHGRRCRLDPAGDPAIRLALARAPGRTQCPP